MKKNNQIITTSLIVIIIILGLYIRSGASKMKDAADRNGGVYGTNTVKKSESGAEFSKQSNICSVWKQLIKEKAKSPSTVYFVGNCINDIYHNDNKYTWESSIDAQNSFGATIRAKFQCWSDGDKSGDCFIFPQ